MNKQSDLVEFLNSFLKPAEDDRTLKELIFDAVYETISELNPFEKYTLSNIVEMGYPMLWFQVCQYHLENEIEEEFTVAVNTGKFSPLRKVGNSKNGGLFQLSDC